MTWLIFRSEFYLSKCGQSVHDFVWLTVPLSFHSCKNICFIHLYFSYREAIGLFSKVLINISDFSWYSVNVTQGCQYLFIFSVIDTPFKNLNISFFFCKNRYFLCRKLNLGLKQMKLWLHTLKNTYLLRRH